MTPTDPYRRRLLAGALASPALALAPRAAADGAEGDERFAAAIRRAEGLDQLHALVIADAGAVRVARAFRGPALARPANVKSVSKTLVALLTGIAIDKGVLPGTEATLAEMAPELIPARADPRVGAITMADLLTMQAGLQRTSGANYGSWVQSSNWVADALSRPMVGVPGQRFLYSTGSFHILGAVLARRSGRSLLALARAWIGGPLGIEIPPWTRDPQGYYLGGNNMALTPRGLARIGQAMLGEGMWQGRQVVSPAWLARSWEPRTRSPFSGHDYGFGWFLAEAGAGAGGRATRVAYARGYGGQMLYVVPEGGITVAITSDPTRPGRSAGYVGALNRLLADDILPAA